MIYQLNNDIPKVDEAAFIAPSADIIGKVTLKKNVTIWFNVVIRADCDVIVIDENTNIQDGSVLHVDEGKPMYIGKNVTVGHKVMLHDCIIGDGSLIGINAVVLSGAKIGKNCLVGANALVTENMEIPDGHMAIGSPVKIIKPLDEASQMKLLSAAQHYVDNGTDFTANLKPIG
jgi:carbonic anhydrase/acetyltransferase-like protein (isoleucine patch superfamily)